MDGPGEAGLLERAAGARSDAPAPAAVPTAPLIAIADVRKVYGGAGGPVALERVSFTIRRREFFLLLGPSGCGKTTLLRLLGGFEHPTEGSILLDDQDLTGLPPHRRPINTVFQSYALFPHLSVAENVAFGLEMLGQPRARVQARVAAMLALVRLDDFAHRRPAQLSGGQQQRVALARALAPAPRLLLLDEPLSALDQKLRKEMQVELKRLQRETGITFVLVTHDQEEALAMADRLAVMQAGRVLQIGNPTEVYDRPAGRFVADFIGDANLVPLALLDRPGGGTLAIRPERVHLVPPPHQDARLTAEVASVTYMGADTLYDLTGPGGAPLRARLRAQDAPPLAVGAVVGVGWEAAAEWPLPD